MHFPVCIGWRSYIWKKNEDGHECHSYHPPDATPEAVSETEQICYVCKQPFKPSGVEHAYETFSGQMEPGCLYWNHDLPENEYWDNHKGPHLMVICPGGGHWNIDSRANNCGMKDDRTHRCWVRHGEPGTPSFHVDKNGLTCKAGAGSIWCNKDAGPPTEYHGFLHNGHFT